jgi:hypothetical protein
MEHTYGELKKKTVAELRAIAETVDHEALKGHTQMHKEQLLAALCTALGIETHEKAAVVGVDKAQIKARIRSLKGERANALSAHDHTQLRKIRRKIKSLKRTIRKASTKPRAH